jgi:hypothetical protein
MPTVNANSGSGGLWLLAGVAGLVVASPLILLAMCAYIENPTSRYETYEAAHRAGAMNEGRWIPSFLPQSSRNIVETHDIDTNRLEITFEYTPGDLGRLPVECNRIGSSTQFQCDEWGSVVLDPLGKGRVSGGSR